MPDPESSARASLFRSMVAYVVLLAGDIAVVWYIAVSGPQGLGYLTMSVIAGVGLLLAYQVILHYRDLRQPLAEAEGTVYRVWKRSDMIITWDSFYITVDRSVYRIPAEEYPYLQERFTMFASRTPPQRLYVKVVHFPNTMTAVSVHEIVEPPAPIDEELQIG